MAKIIDLKRRRRPIASSPRIGGGGGTRPPDDEIRKALQEATSTIKAAATTLTLLTQRIEELELVQGIQAEYMQKTDQRLLTIISIIKRIGNADL
jgi:hypothetical protein